MPSPSPAPVLPAAHAANARVLIVLLREGRPVRFVARGSSMWPAIRDGAVIAVTPCAVDALRVGELVAFEHAGQLVVHRLLARTPDGHLCCAGDALPERDGEVAPEAVLGRAAVVSRPPLRLRLPRRDHLVALYRWGRAALRRHGVP